MNTIEEGRTARTLPFARFATECAHASSTSSTTYRQYLVADPSRPPHEHVIVFDEAQRAWNADFGEQRFERPASEPQLLLEIMGRHPDWCALVCLIGGGQEINTGENGMAEWGVALRSLTPEEAIRWTVVGPPDVLSGDVTTAGLGLGALPSGITVREDEVLRLRVPLRSYRSPAVSDWVSAVLEGAHDRAAPCRRTFRTTRYF